MTDEAHDSEIDRLCAADAADFGSLPRPRRGRRSRQ